MARHPDIDHGYAWIIMLATFGLQYLQSSIYISFSVLLVEFSDIFDIPKYEAALAGSISMGTTCLSGLLHGSLTRRYGCRIISMASGCLTTLGLLLTSFAPNIYVIYFGYGVLTGFGNGGLIVCSNVAVQSAFDKKRNFATGISVMGGSIGGFTFTPVLRLLCDYIGWRGAIRIHSAIVLQSVVLGALLRPVWCTGEDKRKDKKLTGPDKYENRCHDSGENGTDVPDTAADAHRLNQNSSRRCLPCNTTVLKMPMFLIFMLGTDFCHFGTTTMYHHSPSRAVVKNIHPLEASLLPSAIGVMSTIFRFVASIVGNIGCVNRYVYYAVVSAAGGVVTCLSCLTSSVYYGSMIMAGIYGVFVGQIMTLMPTVRVDIVGNENIAMSVGWFLSLLSLCNIISTPLAGFLYDISGDYDLPFLVAGILQIVGGCCLFIIPINEFGASRKSSRLTEEHRVDTRE